nr:integrase, catalytic region, zinc finger, CCHC-type, peptidase aspartic, catalytic [Tanacetum cinerariifolium]
MNSLDPSPLCTPTRVEVPKELPKVSMVNTSLNKLKHHLAGFYVVIKERTMATAITKGSWGFKHTKACFRDEILPFVKALKDIFNIFDQYLIEELTEVQNVFYQMEQAIEQHRLESKTFEVKMTQVLNENERLLEQVIKKDIVNNVVNFVVDNAYVNVHECKKCLKLETELLNKKDLIEKETYDKLYRRYTTLKKHYISLEVETQLNQEIFQRDISVSNQGAINFDKYFELIELKATQKKDTVIRKLKQRIKYLSGNVNEDKVKKDIDETETTNIELDHKVSKLIAENEHLKQTYKLTQEQAAILKEVVKQGKSQNPLNNFLDSAYNHDLCVLNVIIDYLDSGYSKHMTGDRSQLTNFVNKFFDTVKFQNDHVAMIMGYEDYHIRNVTISRVYYVEGPGYNLFFIGQFCDLNLEVAFRQHTYFIYNLEGINLLTGSQGNNLYTLSLGDMMAFSPICVLSKASKTKSWLCVNGKKYILVIVDDYSRFTWVKCLRSKDEAPDFIINFLKMIKLRLKAPQNGVVERRNRMLIEATHTMLIYSKASLFLWAEAVATTCFTQNHSIIRHRHGKTPYELLHDKLPDLSFFHVFGALCYLTNDSEYLGKLQPKADIDFDELTTMAFEHSSLEPVLHEMTLVIISLGLVPNPPSSTSFVPPTRTDWDILFQSMFDELLNPPPSVNPLDPKVIALIAEVVDPEPAASTGSPSSTTVDQDAPSPSNSQTSSETQSQVISNDVEGENHDFDVAHMNNDPLFAISIPENVSDKSASSDVIPTITHTAAPNSE